MQWQGSLALNGVPSKANAFMTVDGGNHVPMRLDMANHVGVPAGPMLLVIQSSVKDHNFNSPNHERLPPVPVHRDSLGRVGALVTSTISIFD